MDATRMTELIDRLRVRAASGPPSQTVGLARDLFDASSLLQGFLAFEMMLAGHVWEMPTA
jgi:hypothetical protein